MNFTNKLINFLRRVGEGSSQMGVSIPLPRN